MFSASFIVAVASYASLTLGQSTSNCNVARWCPYSNNNANCQIRTWNCEDCPKEIADSCSTEDECFDGHVCANGLCCDLANMPNDDPAYCMSGAELEQCGFVATDGNPPLYRPAYIDVPQNMWCGCPFT